MVGTGKAPLRCGGSGSVHKRALGAENRDISCDWGHSSHRGSEVLVTRSSNEDVIGVDGDILVKWGEEKGVEDFLSDLGGSGRHH